MKRTVTIEATPQELAEAFWNLGDDEQAEFFHGLYDAIERTNAEPGAWCPIEYGEMQWYCLATNLSQPEHEKARAMLMALSAGLWLHLTDWLDGPDRRPDCV